MSSDPPYESGPAARTLVLHIGWAKTGTTSLQNFLKLNQDRLLGEHGVCYPCTGRKAAGQHRLGLCLREGGPEPREVWSRLMAELAAERGWHTAIVSSEALRNPDPQRLAMAAALVPPEWQVLIVMYVRQPDLMLESLYLQELKGGYPWASFDKFLAAKRAAGEPDYEGAVTLYQTGFPPPCARVVVRPFEREQWPDGDLVADFLQATGLGDVLADETLRQPPRLNEKASPLLMSLVQALTRRLVGERKPGEQGGFGRLLPSIRMPETSPDEPVLFLDAETREAMRCEHDALFQRLGVSFLRRHAVVKGVAGDLPRFGSLEPSDRERLLRRALEAAVIVGDQAILARRKAEAELGSKRARLRKLEARCAEVDRELSRLRLVTGARHH